MLQKSTDLFYEGFVLKSIEVENLLTNVLLERMTFGECDLVG